MGKGRCGTEKRSPVIKKTALAAAVLAGYYIFVRLTGISLPCVFHEVTGLKCPSCGITHMLLHAAKLEFREALRCNALLFFMLPFLGIVLLIKIAFMPKWLGADSRFFKGMIFFCCVLLVAFGIVRNIATV